VKILCVCNVLPNMDKGGIGRNVNCPFSRRHSHNTSADDNGSAYGVAKVGLRICV
jgi:hypothetical protein